MPGAPVTKIPGKLGTWKRRYPKYLTPDKVGCLSPDLGYLKSRGLVSISSISLSPLSQTKYFTSYKRI